MEEKYFNQLNEDYEYVINLDDANAKQIGFTSDKYAGYIHVDYGDYYVLAESKTGNLNDMEELFLNILKNGNSLVVEMPSDKIVELCKELKMSLIKGGNGEIVKAYLNPLKDNE